MKCVFDLGLLGIDGNTLGIDGNTTCVVSDKIVNTFSQFMKVLVFVEELYLQFFPVVSMTVYCVFALTCS